MPSLKWYFVNALNPPMRISLPNIVSAGRRYLDGGEDVRRQRLNILQGQTVLASVCTSCALAMPSAFFETARIAG